MAAKVTLRVPTRGCKLHQTEVHHLPLPLAPSASLSPQHGINWIRNAWVTQASTDEGYQTRVFRLAAADRNNEVMSDPPALPSDVRLSARAPIPARSYMSQGESAYLYLTYRGQYSQNNGVYLHEMSFEPSNGHIGK